MTMVRETFARWRALMARRDIIFTALLPSSTPIDLRLLGRTLVQAIFVGLAAGFVGALFFASLESVSHIVLRQGAGYHPLLANGEKFAEGIVQSPYRWWMLMILPAIGGLLCGLIIRISPEVRGGGADLVIESFHHRAGILRRRLIWWKPIASLFTLATGGAGGREGPTMLIGGALGSNVGRMLGVSTRERRILVMAGVAAGIAAVFRTPLGAALLAAEVLYQDGFESDVLIPSVLASVVAYSVVISIYGQSNLLSHPGTFQFRPTQLPLYLLLAIVISIVAIMFVNALHFVHHNIGKLPIASWLQPAAGGLMLGVFSVPMIYFVGHQTGVEGQGLGLLGGGYGAVQMAISGSTLLREGWEAVGMLCLLGLAKIVASSLTIGSGGSAGDFAPSLAIGGLIGGAFGRAAQLLLHDPSIHPGAFALVGMGAFYGGVAHVPLAATVLVCELAGSYELLVPLMLAMGVSYIALRKYHLYPSQAASPAQSPVHREVSFLEMLRTAKVSEVELTPPMRQFDRATTVAQMLEDVRGIDAQDVLVVVDAEKHLVGLVSGTTLNTLFNDRDALAWAVLADVMQPPVYVLPTDDMRTAVERLLNNNLRAIPVVDTNLHVLGFIDEADIARRTLRTATNQEQADLEVNAYDSAIAHKRPPAA